MTPKTSKRALVLSLLLLAPTVGCSSGDDTSGVSDAAVIGNYADHVLSGYAASAAKAEALQEALQTLVDSPTSDTLTAAREAWLAAREPYGQTEVFRFYEGPIDEVEGEINAWPLDEAFIDYVKDDPTAGLINAVADFPTLDTEVIVAQNERGGEKNIATGYHAIEFLLWGQDFNVDGPGDRPATDYVTGDGGTAANQDRRGQYLTIVGDRLVADLRQVRDAWEDGATYADEFRTLPLKEALKRMLLGMGSLAGSELSGERMRVAYDNKDQEDEHSCFSDNTTRDLHLNALGIQNVYLGRYDFGGEEQQGPGIYDLVQARDATLADKLKTQLEETQDAIDAIPAPFDQALLDDDAREKIDTAIKALQTEAETIVEVASAFGIEINLE